LRRQTQDVIGAVSEKVEEEPKTSDVLHEFEELEKET